MLKHMWTCCRSTRGRFECTTGGVFESTRFFFHVFQRAAIHTNTHTHKHNTATHTTPHGDRQRETDRQTDRQTDREWERKREKERQKERDKTRKEKKREDERGETRKDKWRGEKKKDKWRDKMKKEREDESENERENEERSEMKEKCDFPKCLGTFKPARWISPKCFEKNPFRTNYSSIVLRKFRIRPCFQFFTWFEFVFSGRRNQFRMRFGAHGTGAPAAGGQKKSPNLASKGWRLPRWINPEDRKVCFTWRPPETDPFTWKRDIGKRADTWTSSGREACYAARGLARLDERWGA